MKFAATLLAVAAGVSAEAVFKVSDFSASCIPHSANCMYKFGLLQPGTMQTEPQTCTAMVTADNGNELPEVIDGKCEDTSRTFNIFKGEGVLTVFVTQPVTPNSDQSGKHIIQASELEMQGENTGVHQVYVGPTEFDLTP